MPVSTIQTTTNKQIWAPAAANAVSVTPNAVAWNSSNWSELISAVGATSVLTALSIEGMGTSASAVRLEIDIGTGAMGSEVVIATLPAAAILNSNFWGPGLLRFTIPIDNVANGARLAVRMRHSGTDVTAWAFAVGYMAKPLTGGPVLMQVSAVAPFVSPSAADNIALTAAGNPSSAWASGAWTTILANPLQNAVLVGYVIDYVQSSGVGEYDLAIGPVGSEVLIHTTKFANMGQPTGPEYVELVNPLDAIKMNVRVAGRQRVSTSNNTTTIGTKLTLMNKPL